MKKKNIVLPAIALLVLGIAASAQKTTDFSGTWNLDVAKSKLGDRNMIESQTLTVTQTAADITIQPATKRLPPPADAPMGGGGRPGGMGGGMGGGDMATTYTLDGKDKTVEQDTPMGKIPVIFKAKVDGAKLTLSSSRTFSGPMGEVTMTTKEAWELSADGNTLTINVERVSPRGTDTTTKVFVKKQ